MQASLYLFFCQSHQKSLTVIAEDSDVNLYDSRIAQSDALAPFLLQPNEHYILF